MSEEKTYSESEYSALNEKLGEFRDNNVQLKKDMEKMQDSVKKFDGIDVDAYHEMLKRQQDEKDKKLIDAGKIDELVEERVKRMREEHDGQMTTLTQSNESMKRQLEGLVIDNAARAAAANAGIVSTAVDDVLFRVRGTFSLDGDKAVPKDQNGAVIYGSDGATPVSIEEWVKGLSKSAPHLFAQSIGGGSQHGNNAGGGEDTIDRVSFDKMNPLEQASFVKKGGNVVD